MCELLPWRREYHLAELGILRMLLKRSLLWLVVFVKCATSLVIILYTAIAAFYKRHVIRLIDRLTYCLFDICFLCVFVVVHAVLFFPFERIWWNLDCLLSSMLFDLKRDSLAVMKFNFFWYCTPKHHIVVGDVNFTECGNMFSRSLYSFQYNSQSASAAWTMHRMELTDSAC